MGNKPPPSCIQFDADVNPDGTLRPFTPYLLNKLPDGWVSGWPLYDAPEDGEITEVTEDVNGVLWTTYYRDGEVIGWTNRWRFLP